MTDQQLEHKEYIPSDQLKDIHLLCLDLQSPANIGAIFRLADAFAVRKLLFATPIDLSSHRLRKMARETYKIVPYKQVDNVFTTLTDYKENEYTVIALELTTSSIPIIEIPKNQPKMVLIIGHEKHGIPQEILDITTHTAHIPMFGRNSSMNVAQATAIALYELSFHRYS